MSMPSPIPQRTISISVLGIDENADVLYSYWSPVTGRNHTDEPRCDLVCNRPIRSLFVLDYPSTINGWIITGSYPHAHSRELPPTMGPDNLSISYFNDDEYVGDTYRFYIEYKNTVTEKIIKVDPQEGNIPKGG